MEVTDLSGNWTETEATYAIPEGSDWQPIGIDVDNDGDIELIGSNGDYLKIWSYSEALGLHLESEKDMGVLQNSTITAIEDFDNDSYIEFIVSFGTNVSVFEWNTTHINIELSNSSNISTGIICNDNLSCFWGDGNRNDVIEFNLSNGLIYNWSIDFPTRNVVGFNTLYGQKQAPSMADIDRDGQKEIIFIYSTNRTHVSRHQGNETILMWGKSVV